MLIWKYELGQWIKDAFEMLDWPEDLEDYNQYLKIMGLDFGYRKEWGSEFEDHIILYPHEKGEYWIGEFVSSDHTFYFYIDNFPSYLMFKKECSSLFNNKNEFICVHGDFINKNFIESISIRKNSSEETAHIQVGTETFTKNFPLQESPTGKKRGGLAERWVREVLDAEE